MATERQALNATFFAFRKRERGGVLAGASLIYVVLAFAIIAGFIVLNLGAIGAVASWYVQLVSATASGDAAAAANMTPPVALLGLLPTYLLVLFFTYLLLASYEAACLRWMIRGETGGLFGLTLGADTWRVYSTYWIWFLLYLGYTIVMGIAMVAVTAALVASGDAPGAAAVAIIPVFYLVFYGAMIFFAVRLAPAAASSIARRKFSFFKAWTVTKGRFWAMFGAYVLLVVLYLIGFVVLGAIVVAVMAASVAPMATALGPDAAPEQVLSTVLPALFSPQNLVMVLAAYAALLMVGLMLMVALFGVSARAVLVALEEGKIDAPAAPAG